MSTDPEKKAEYEVEDACDVREDTVFALNAEGKAVRLEVPDDADDDCAQ